MLKYSMTLMTALIAAGIIFAADWPGFSGNPQRDGWAKSEKSFTKENAGKIELLYKVKAANESRGLASLTSPVINGNLITYLGFKEMLVFGGSSNNVFSVDADLNRSIWKVHLDYKSDKPQAAPTSTCPGGLTASLVMPGSSTAGGRGPGGGRGRGVPGGRGLLPPGFPPQGGGGRGGMFASGFGRGGVFLALAGDGALHALNTSTGGDKIPPVKFVPPNSKVTSLNLNDSVVYAATQDDCGGNPNALYALDMSGEEEKRAIFETNGHGLAGAAGTAIGTDGIVYGLAADGQGAVAGVYNDTVLAFSKDLKVKDYFTPSGTPLPTKKDVPTTGATPVVFQWKTKDVIVAGSRDGRLYLLDSASLGGADHHTPLSKTNPITSPDTNNSGNGFRESLSSWEDTETNTRWVYVSISGPIGADAGFSSNGAALHGSIAAFKVEDRNGQPALIPAWASRDMMSPAAPVTANGLVFALSTGESGREAKENGTLYTIAEHEKMAGRATLYVLDGATGKEMYSSGNMTSTFSHGSGIAIANKRIYFSTHDNTMYCLGFLADQPQLTGK